jgi:hydrogenase maturation protein HypF
MLPWTPLQHLLVAGPCAVLVMTSGNLSGEPLICTNDGALERLGDVADGFLLSDLRTVQRTDDSVMLAGDGDPVPVRRSRGFAPRPIILPAGGPGVVAVGGDLKNAPCVTRDSRAYMGQHVGDLAHADALDLAASTIRHLRVLSGAEPRLVVHDLHPDYQSTALALRIADQEGIPTLAVQHHHAHALACLAERGHHGPALALVLDGAGYGVDGTTWGGELLWVDGLRVRRLGHLAPLALPGGDRAAREPWRMALAALHEALGDGELPGHLLAGMDVDEARVRGVWQLLGRPGSFPATSSCGRWFDAVASLLGVRHEVSYEGQAAVELEGIAAGAPAAGPGPFGLEVDDEGSLIVDLLPWIRRWARDPGRDVPALARAFHDTLAAALVEATLRAVEHTGVDDVALSGGAFVNALLAGQVVRGLRGAGVRVWTHRSVPPGDGGLALGQAWAGVLATQPR